MKRERQKEEPEQTWLNTHKSHQQSFIVYTLKTFRQTLKTVSMLNKPFQWDSIIKEEDVTLPRPVAYSHTSATPMNCVNKSRKCHVTNLKRQIWANVGNSIRECFRLFCWETFSFRWEGNLYLNLLQLKENTEYWVFGILLKLLLKLTMMSFFTTSMFDCFIEPLTKPDIRAMSSSGCCGLKDHQYAAVMKR